MISAFEQVFPESLRQRCAVHVARNLLEKVSKPDQEEVKAAYWAILNEIEAPPGEEAVAIARQRAEGFADSDQGRYPKAVECLLDNLSALTAHLHFPAEHRERIRHSNLLERTFGESRRRVEVIGRLPGEDSRLSLVWAVLDRASLGARGLARHPSSQVRGPRHPSGGRPGAPQRLGFRSDRFGGPERRLMRRVMAPVAQGGPMMVAPGSLLPGFYTADWTPPTKALSALDESCRPGATGVGRIALDDQILGPWLQTVTTTLGQHQPATLRQLRRLL